MLSHLDKENLVERFGFPIYVYEQKIIEDKVNILKSAFPDFEIFYSFKANPNESICSFLQTQGLGADTASANEVLKAVNNGYGKNNILYSSPGKTKEDIEKTINKCTIVADSYNELKMINTIARDQKMKLKVGIRINPNYSISNEDALELMGGYPSKFGVDEESLMANKSFIDSLENIEIVGIHVYMGSQILDYTILFNNIKSIFKIAEFCITKMLWHISFIDFGGGFGVPYSSKEKPIDFNILKPMIEDLVAGQTVVTKDKVRLILESGRFLVTEAGYFLTKIVDIKESRGKKYLMVHGGMNGFFRPIFMNLLHPITIPQKEGGTLEKVSVGGNLCTPIDLLADDIFLPKASIGDILCINNAGSYGYTMSLKEFIDQPQPREIYID